MLFVTPKETAVELDPKVASLLSLLQKALSDKLEESERESVATQVYTDLEKLLPRPHSQQTLDDGQLQIWSSIQNLQGNMESAITLLENFQKDIPEMQTQLADQADMASKVDDLTAAVDAMSATVDMMDKADKVGLV